MGMVMTFTFPLPPNRGNARGHSYYESFAKKRYFMKLDRIFGEEVHTKHEPLSFALYRAHCHVPRYMDSDNLVGRFKFIFDWLVARNFIFDDGPRHFWPAAFPTMTVAAKGAHAFTIEIIPSDPTTLDHLREARHAA